MMAELTDIEKKIIRQVEVGNLLVLIITWVKVFRINPEFRILRLTFHRKSASTC